MNNIFLIIILQGFLFSLPYNIYGSILDLNTQESIENANIYIENQEIIGTITDKEGYFNLSLNNVLDNQVNVNIKVIGYEEKVILVELLNSKIDLGTIYLINKSIELESVHIHSHYSSIDKSKQISDILISESELDETIKGNIATTLANQPNIGISSYGAVTSKPALRGFSGDRFLLTKNGNETGDLSQSSIDHVITLDMSEVSRIEIIRGPKSLIYGANTIGGVVNTSLIGSSKVRVDNFHQKYSIGGESFNGGLYGNMMLYIPIANNQINLFASDKNTSNEISPVGELDNTQSHVTNYKLKFTNYNKRGYVNYSFEDYNMVYGIPPNIGGHESGVDILLNKRTGQLKYHRDISENIFNQLDIEYNFIDYIHLELEDGSVDSNDIFEVLESGDYHLGLAKKTYDFQIELRSNNAQIGFELNKKNFSPTATGLSLTPITDESYLSIYAFREKKYVSVSNIDFDFLSSFRLGYLSVNPKLDDIQYVNLDESQVKKRIFKTTSISFGIKQKIDNLELNSWVMHTMRPPRVEELFSDGPHLASYSYEIGNPNLEVEKIYGIENSISYSYEPYKFSLVTFFNYSPYYHEMAQMGACDIPSDWNPWETHPCSGSEAIDWGSGGSAGVGFLYKYKARGSRAIIQGLEFGLQYKLENLEMNYDFSYVKGDNRTLNIPLSYMNPTKQILTFNYNKNFMNYKLRFSKIHSQNRLGEFETYTPGAFLTDFVLTYRISKHKIVFQFNNIFDEKYYNHLSRIKNITPEPGKNINFIYKITI